MKVFIIFLLLIVAGVPSSYADDNCTVISNCQECVNATCSWVKCLNFPESCEENLPPEMCQLIPCDDTTTTSTTTASPTTTTTTASPTTTPTEKTTTIEPTTLPTTEPTSDTTTELTTDVPTESPTTAPITTPPETPSTTEPSTTTSEIPTSTEPSTTVPSSTPSPCTGHHFDAGSFFGGIFLAVGVLVASYAGFRFYRARNGRSYNQLQTVY